MKKILVISLTLCGLFVFTGCGDKEAKYEKTMREYATNYYNAVLKGTEGLTSYPVSVAKLKDAVAKKIVNFDMSKLSKCTDESYVELIINQTNNEVDSVNFHMSCEK